MDRPVPLASFDSHIRAILHLYTDRMKQSRLSAGRWECKDVLAMDLIPDIVDGRLKGALGEKGYLLRPGHPREQLGEIGFGEVRQRGEGPPGDS